MSTLALGFFLVPSGIASAANTPVVGAYYTEWSVYGRAFPVEKIPFDKITHLLYSFIPICGPNDSLATDNPSGHQALQTECASKQPFQITIHDTWAAVQEPHNNYRKLAEAKAAHPHLKILPSIGGWTLSDPFFELARRPESRAVFIKSCLEFLRQYPFFDGIDIDWEYPGGGGSNPSLGGAEDTVNHANLMKELRAALDAFGREKNRTYLLTSAVGAAPSNISAVDYRSLFANPASPTLDLVFAMTYDYYGAWDGVRGPLAGLYQSSDALREDFNGAATIRNLMNAGVPAQNLVLGVAMYGRAWEGVQSTKATSSNVYDESGRPFSLEQGMWEPGIMDYKFIASKYRNDPNFTYIYDAQAKAPFLWSAHLGKLITYEDACSTQEKFKFVKSMNLAGTFAWEIDADNGDILNAMMGNPVSNCP